MRRAYGANLNNYMGERDYRPVNIGRNRTQERPVLRMKIIMLSTILILLTCNGCITSRQGLYVGQLADVATTAVALHDGAEEGNPMCENIEDVLIMKACTLLIAEGAAYLWPKYANAIYAGVGINGAGFALWNTSQIIINQ